MESVIFLDIDGVLNTVPPVRPIEPDKVRLLARLVHTTGAGMILHSGWRIWFDDEMQPLCTEASLLADLLAAEGLHLSGMTPDLTTEEIRRTRKFSLVKASEILAWLRDHPQVRRWCVMDDLDLHNDDIKVRQVRPDAAVGLSEANVIHAIQLLKH